MPRVASCPNVRQAVIDAARHLMEKYGYRKMTIDDIASEIGIGKATLYGYFENKQEVALAVIDGYHREIQSNWIEIVESDQPAPQKIRAMVLYRILYLFEVASRHDRSLDDSLAQLRSLVLTQRDHYNEVEAEIMSRVLLQGCDAGDFSCESPMETAHTILACTAGLMPLNLSPRELASREEVADKSQKVIDLILRGIAAEPFDNHERHDFLRPEQTGLEEVLH